MAASGHRIDFENKGLVARHRKGMLDTDLALRCQNVIANINPMSRSLPFVFSEQGIYMLATVLKSELAVHQSIIIMRAFKNMRHYIIENRQLASKENF